MALHLAANGCYGVMIYNNKDYPDSYINEELKKYGKVHETQKGGKNLIFIYYKQYEEARACLDALSSDPDFNAKPAKPRETSRAVASYGARERAKSVGERVKHKFEPYHDNKQMGEKSETDLSSNKEEEQSPLRKRSMSITNISIEKVENSTTADKSDTDVENEETKKDDIEEPKSTNQEISVECKQKTPFRPRSKSVGRLNVEDEIKRAELIKKVIKCESNVGGSLDSLFEKEIENKPLEETKEFTPKLHSSKSYHENLNVGDFNNSWKDDNRRKSNLWLTPKPNFYKSRNGNPVNKREFNEPYLLPAMTIYEHSVIVKQPKKFSQIVVITGLPLYITEEYLCDLCAKFARVLRIRLIDTRNIQECRAYVYVKSKRDAINLKRNINRKILFCHIVEVMLLSEISNVFSFIKN